MRAESWRPRVGDRVRVRAEVGRTFACSEMHHHPEEAGHLGRVLRDSAVAGVQLHRFLVAFDRPAPTVWIAGAYQQLPARHYAADELEPVGARAPATESVGTGAARGPDRRSASDARETHPVLEARAVLLSWPRCWSRTMLTRFAEWRGSPWNSMGTA